MSSFLQVKLPGDNAAGGLLQDNSTAPKGFSSQLLELAKGISGEIDSGVVIRTALLSLFIWVSRVFVAIAGPRTNTASRRKSGTMCTTFTFTLARICRVRCSFA